jgi:putative intracellular protease/amidase
MPQSIRILFVATSHNKLGDTTRKTGVWLEELAAPYYIFRDAGAEVTIASPDGGPVPLDPKSQSIIVATPPARRFLKDAEAMNFLSSSVLLSAIDADDFDGVFLPGGHGPLWDIAGNETVKRLLEAFNSGDKPIGSVCHGVAGLLTLQNDKGELLIKGRQLTGFSNSEEQSTGLALVVPFLVETQLLSLGALYSKGDDYTSYVVEDGNLITGQNPASSEEAAKKLVALLKNNAYKAAVPQPA